MTAGLALEIRNAPGDPGDQQYAQAAHHHEDRSPADDAANQCPGGDADRKRQWRSDHGEGDGAALKVLRRHATGVPGQQGPDEAREHAGDEAGAQGQHIAGRDRRDDVDQKKSANGHHEKRPPSPSASGCSQGDGGHERAQGIGGDQLAHHGLGRGQIGAHLEEEPRRQSLGEDGEEAGGGQSKETENGETVIG